MTEAVVEDVVVASDVAAMWEIEKRSKIIATAEELIAFYKDKIKKVEEDRDFRVAQCERSLQAYFETVPHKKTRTQESYSLPGCKLVLKTQNPEYKRDDKTIIDWLEKNNGSDYVKIEKKLDWSGLKAKTDVFGGNLVSEDGEIIPGVEVIERPAKFCVE